MSSTSETGHSKNVANFEQLIAYVTSYGTTYNPTKASIKLPALQTLLTNSKNSLSAVYVAQANYSNAVAARDAAFKPLSKLTTRILNAIKATDTTSQVDDNALTLVRKIQGKRATTVDKTTADTNAPKTASTSQMSFDMRLDNLDKLIKLLASIPLYAPNENELKVATLTTLYNDLKAKNTAVQTTTTALSNARISRNDVLYKSLTGLVDITSDTKTYIKSLFGAVNEQFKQVSKLAFRVPNNL
jgi:hypothetical protein